MSNEHPTTDDRTADAWGFAIAALIVAALVVGFLTLGLPGVGLVMVAATPVIFVILILISVGG